MVEVLGVEVLGVELTGALLDEELLSDEPELSDELPLFEPLLDELLSEEPLLEELELDEDELSLDELEPAELLLEVPEVSSEGLPESCVRPASGPHTGQAPGPCEASTFSAIAICWSGVARLAEEA